MKYLSLIHALNVLASAIAFTNNPILSKPIQRSGKVTKLCGFFDDFLRRTLGDDVDNKEDSRSLGDDASSSVTSGQNDEIGLSEKDFRNEIERRKMDDMLVQESTVITSSDSSEEEREFDGYMVSYFAVVVVSLIMFFFHFISFHSFYSYSCETRSTINGESAMMWNFNRLSRLVFENYTLMLCHSD
jgi:hypothetical protein